MSVAQSTPSSVGRKPDSRIMPLQGVVEKAGPRLPAPGSVWAAASHHGDAARALRHLEVGTRMPRRPSELGEDPDRIEPEVVRDRPLLALQAAKKPHAANKPVAAGREGLCSRDSLDQQFQEFLRVSAFPETGLIIRWSDI